MERETPLFPPLPAFALAEGFPEATGALADAGAVLETGFAGSGFLTGAFETVLAGVVSFGADFLAAAFLAGAFLTAGVGLTDFPEGFRDGEGLDFFFNVAQLVPKSRARKVR